MVAVRRVARLGSGHTPSRKVDEYWENCTVPWLTLADVGQLRSGTVTQVDATKELISELGIANSAAVVHPAGTVAMSRTASVGYTCILGVDMATSQDFATWTCGPLMEPRFLLWGLRGMMPTILGRTQGSTHKTIYMPDIEQITVPLAPLRRQRGIADFLDSETARIDALIAKKRRLRMLLAERGQASVERLLASDRSVPLRRIASLLPGYTFPSEQFSADYAGRRLLRGVNVNPGRLRWDDCVYLADTGHGVQRYELQQGDIVLGMDRPFVSGGTRVAEVDEEAEGALLVQRVCRIRTSTRAERVIIRSALASKRFTAHVEPDLTGVSVPHLSEEQIGSVPIPAFAAPDAERRADEILEVERSLRAVDGPLDRQIALLQEHRQALITAAVTGELDIA